VDTGIAYMKTRCR